MHKQRTGMLVCAGIGVLSCFLPWVTLPIVGSVNGMQGNDGIIMIILFAPAIALTLSGDQSQALSGGKIHGAAIPAVLTSLFSVVKVIDFNEEMSAMRGDSNPWAAAMSSTVSIGIGLYLLCVVGIVCAVIGYKNAS